MCYESQKVKKIGKRWRMLLFSFLIVGAIFIHVAEAKASTTDFTGWTAISTAEELQKLSSNSESSRFYLTNDIDMSRYGYWQTISVFKGTFDGNGHCIKNLKSTTGGLFGELYPGATIRNLRLEDVDIRTSRDAGGIAEGIYYSSSIAESLAAAGAYYKDSKGHNMLLTQPIMISNCAVSGVIAVSRRVGSGVADTTYVGGILAHTRKESCWYNDGEYIWSPEVVIDACINVALISAEISNYEDCFTSQIYAYAGGIVGWMHDMGTVSNCMNFGEVSADGYLASRTEFSTAFVKSYQGGIVGLAVGGKLNNCYSGKNISSAWIETVCGSYRVEGGSIVGWAQKNVVLNGCYYYGGRQGKVTSLFKATKMSRYDRSNKSSYSGWDFDRVWTVDPGINSGYPVLQWYLPYVEIEAPTANMQSGKYSKAFSVELASHLNDAKIYYTTDGSTPSASSTQYTGSITISENTVLKIVAIIPNGVASAVSTYEYEFACMTPTANYKSGTSFSEPAKIKLSTTETGGQIYYTTNGNNPTTNSKVYKDGITLYKDTEIRAMVVKAGKDKSEVASWTFHVSVKTPKASKPSGTYNSAVKVKLGCKTKGAQIYYTTNGKTPTAKSKRYKGAFTIGKNTTLKVIAINKNVKSSVATYDYNVKVETPVSNKTEGSYKNGVTVRLGCKTKNATIYYTTDGSRPSIYSKCYTGPIRLNQSTKIKAIAVKNGMENSDVFSAQYYIYK